MSAICSIVMLQIGRIDDVTYLQMKRKKNDAIRIEMYIITTKKKNQKSKENRKLFDRIAFNQ